MFLRPPRVPLQRSNSTSAPALICRITPTKLDSSRQNLLLLQQDWRGSHRSPENPLASPFATGLNLPLTFIVSRNVRKTTRGDSFPRFGWF